MGNQKKATNVETPFPSVPILNLDIDIISPIILTPPVPNRK